MAEIIACPSCQKKLQVPESFFGQTVQCPECKSTFVAQPSAGMAAPGVALPPAPPRPSASIPPPLPLPPLNAVPIPSPPPPAPAPSSKSAEWDKPASGSRRNKWGDEVEEEEERGRKRKRRPDDDEDEDEDDDRPRRRRYREPVMPHRGGAILVLGIIGFLFCLPGVILGPLAWSMGSSDLEAMRSGRMDPEGEGITQAGRILGILSTIASIAVIGLGCLGFVAGNQR